VETGGPGPFCPVCGTYLATPPPLPADSVAGAQPGWQNDDEQSAKDKRTALKFGFGLLVVLLAIVGPVAASHSSWTHHSSSSRQLSYTQLSAGDCLVGSNLGLNNNSSPWPAVVTAVPCKHRHLAEIFYVGNVWPQSLAYPGYNAIADQGYARCLSAFLAYDGIAQPASAFAISYTAPDRTTWPAGDRHVICAAYQPYLGAANGVQPVTYSIKGSRR
jgi:hypothetical protein